MTDDLPERYNLGRSCGVMATLLTAVAAMLALIVRRGER